MGHAFRRSTLITSTAGAAIFAFFRYGLPKGPVDALGPAAFTGPPTTMLRLVRSADQLDVVIELSDAAVVDENVVAVTGPDPAIRLTFGAQHTTERTFVGPTPTPPTTGINHIAAGDSVVVVPITGSFPFTVDGLLDAAEATAGVTGQSTEGEPDGSVTAIEVPAGLWLSPASPARLVAAREPFTASGTTEVWAARLERTTGSGALDLAAIHCSPDDLLITQVPDAAALPATFIDDATAHGTGAAQAPAMLRDVANSAERLARREVDLRGQRVAYADPLAGSGTSKATHRFRLTWDGPDDDAVEGDLEAARTPAIYGVLEHADVVDDVIGSATGSAGDTIEVALHERWLDFGNLADNFDLAFLKLKDPASSLIGSGGAVGGVAQFDILAEVFNQSAGVGLDLESPTSPWEPETLLGQASKIVGNILLEQVIVAVENGVPGLDVPGTTTTVDGDTVTVAFTFCPTLHDLDAVGFRTVPGQTRCCVHVTTTASLTDSIEASFETEMRVENFLLEFPPAVPPVVRVDFESVVGTISSDGSTAIVPTVREWDFSGAISMLMALVDKLGLGNVELKIVGDVIDMDSSINLPDISLGVAEIKNFAINLGLDLPLGDGPGELSVGIGKKSSPLDIDVMMFGATFWLDIDLGFSGLETPTTTTSMGVSVYWEMLDFDIVVVKISFALRLSADWKLSGGEVVFTGAVSLEGEIEVLGVISVSASLVCSLRYESADEEMVLRGTVHYCVDSFLGKVTSGTVPIGRTTIELGDGQGADTAGLRRAVTAAPLTGAAGGAASFADRYAAPVWADYCDAFA